MEPLKKFFGFIFSANVLSFVSLFYLFFYWFFLIFFPYEIPREELTYLQGNNFFTLVGHPLVFIGFLLTALLSVGRSGYNIALDEVVRNKSKALIEIYKKKQELVQHVNLSRLIIKTDVEELVRNFLEKVVKDNKLQP